MLQDIVNTLKELILSTWDHSFPIALGNEIPGGGLPNGRPWKGTIREASLNVDGDVVDLLSSGALVLPGGWWDFRPRISRIGDLDRMVTGFHCRDFVVNLVGFAMLAPLLMIAYGRRLPTASVLIIGALLSLSIEISQIAIPGRYPSLTDFILNVAGAAVGAGLLKMLTGRNVSAPG